MVGWGGGVDGGWGGVADDNETGLNTTYVRVPLSDELVVTDSGKLIHGFTERRER